MNVLLPAFQAIAQLIPKQPVLLLWEHLSRDASVYPDVHITTSITEAHVQPMKTALQKSTFSTVDSTRCYNVWIPNPKLSLLTSRHSIEDLKLILRKDGVVYVHNTNEIHRWDANGWVKMTVVRVNYDKNKLSGLPDYQALFGSEEAIPG